MNTALYATASIQLSKSIDEVFEAIANPDKINKYFVEKSTGQLVENTTIEWKFPEFDDYFPIYVKKITAPTYISFDWNGGRSICWSKYFWRKLRL